MWRLLNSGEQRRLLAIIPLLIVSAIVEVVGVASVIPFLSILADPASIASLPYVGDLLGNLSEGDPLTLLRWAGMTLAGVLLVANVLVILTNWWLYRFAWGLNHSISARLLKHYLRQPYSFILNRNTAELANRVVVDVLNLIDQGVRSGLEIITRVVVVAALIAFLILLDPLTAMVALLSLGSVYGAIFVTNRRYLRSIGKESVAAGAERLAAVNEALGGFKDLRVVGREAAAYQQYIGPSKRFAEAHATVHAISALPRYALEAVAVGGLVLIASLMAGRGAGLVGTLPLIGAYAFAGLRLMPAMQVLFFAAARMRFAMGALEAIEADFKYLDDLEPPDDVGASEISFSHSIELRGVDYTYPLASGPALNDITVTIGIQQSVGVVGRTGSGKTTLVDLLLGLLAPSRGEILVDGVVIDRSRIRAYRRLFGYVPQSIYLVDGSIARNVAFGIPEEEVDMEAVRRACDEAQISDFIERELPDGYGTLVGERGIRLSGGQRQRIGIARALYLNPPVLVFDEATSSLDVHTEQLVYQSLEGLAANRTVVTIAHRLDTVVGSDMIIALEHGKVALAGTPQEVLRSFKNSVGSAPRLMHQSRK